MVGFHTTTSNIEVTISSNVVGGDYDRLLAAERQYDSVRKTPTSALNCLCCIALFDSMTDRIDYFIGALA